MTDSIEGIRIEADEDGWHMILEGDFMETFFQYVEDADMCSVDLKLPQDVAIKLATIECAQVREWWAEGQAAAASYVPPVDPDDCGYALDDPKHPTYHDRMSDLADRR